MVVGVATGERHRKDGGPSGRRRGSEVPMRPGNVGGGKDPHFGKRLRRREGAAMGDEPGNAG